MKFETNVNTKQNSNQNNRTFGRQRHTNELIDTKDFIARPYQIELYEICKSRNTIVCLNTGSGKTFIAVMLIKHFSPQLHHISQEDQKYGFEGKRTFFLVPLVPLVSQQANVIRAHTDLRVGQFHGKSYDEWNRQMWTKEFNKYDVFVMIDEIFRKILNQGFIPLSKVNLLVIDEAHRAVKNHPYREIMRSFDQCPVEKQPRILGLSASLIMKNASPFVLEKLIRKLEETMRSTCETATDLRTINKYASKPNEVLVKFSPFDMQISPNIKIVKYFADSCIEFLNDINYEGLGIQKSTVNLKTLCKSIQDTLYILGAMGVWCAAQVANLYIRELSDTVEMLRSSKSHYTAFLSAVLTTLNVIKVQLSDILEGLSDLEKLVKYTSPKLIALSDLLKEYNPQNNKELSTNLCGIVFAERRSVARILCFWLQELVKLKPNEFEFLKVDYVLGHGGRTGVGNSSAVYMSNKKQEESLRKFRSHDCNLLVATSVLEEGLDVPRCNLVVRYDPPKDFRQYVQSKGRARAEKGKYAIFVENSRESLKVLTNDLKKYKNTEIILNNCCHKRVAPTEAETDESFDDQLMEPYVPNKVDGTARVTLNSAIAIVNRYCLKLPSDSFTKLTPQFNIVDEENGLFRCRLRLPINSQIRHEIVGNPMPNKRTAKKASALYACQILHEAKELDDNFLPVGKETIRFIDELGLEPSDDEIERVERGPRPGTTKRRQYYNKMVANVLKESSIRPNINCYLYMFSMKLSYPIPEEQNTRGRKITDPAESTRNFGILTTQIVPPICDFPVFTRSGEVTVAFEFVSQNICLSSEQIEELHIFHDFTFKEVLRLIKYPLLFDPIKSNCKYLIVPVNEFGDKNYRDIDWDFVHLIKRQKESPLRLISEEERKNFVFNPDIYNDAVVIPWYRKDKPQFFFYVAEICDNLTPKSLFPDEGYETFEKYYLSKYNIRIMNTSQPLLDVDHTSARLNLLTPRYVNRKGISLPTSTAKTKKEKRENLQQKQILVPELCIVHPFPGSLWRKAVCLPCMLYRLNSLLVAEQLRTRVAKESGVGIVETNADMSWPPLDFGWTLAQVMAQNLEQETESKDVESNELVKEVHETWDFMTSEENIIAIENKENDCDLLNTSSEENANTNNELVIDTFDPNNYNIDEIYDFEDDEEMENMEWTEYPINIIGGPNGFSSTTVPNYWGFNSNTNNNVQIREIENNDSSDDNILVRIGSPSYFNVSALNEREVRGREWDFDDQIITSSVYNIGLPGLEVISCADGLNIDELSKDLAKCHVEVFDSSDETSDIEDLESDDEDDDNEGLVQSNQRKNMVPNRTFNNRNKISDILRYELLHNSPANDEDINDSNEKMIRTLHKDVFAEDNFVEETENLSPNSTEDFLNENNVEENDFDYALEEMGLTKLLNDYIKEDKNEDLNDFEVSDEEFEQKDMQLEENFGEVLIEEKTSHETRVLCVESICFGDLLPDRDTNDLSKEPFSVKFDPLKTDETNIGPSPSMILQALTMSNASDGINLERLETVGDSFLKYAVTAFLYCVCPGIHEGKLSYLRSRQISNLNLYRLGKKIGIGEFMNATKFEPNDNWCPPCYTIPQGLEEALIESGDVSTVYDIGMIEGLNKLNEQQIRDKIRAHKNQIEKKIEKQSEMNNKQISDHELLSIPYNLLTQHSIPDKSIADCVEALIGAYLISSGPRGALLFMKWLDLKVMPNNEVENDDPNDLIWHWLPTPKSPLLLPSNDDCDYTKNLKRAQNNLNELYIGHKLNVFEDKIGYSFRDKAYLVQAFTHNSYYENQVTDCYQRLEFLGDAVLDYLITRYLYEDPAGHSPGTLTDLRSALVNNTFFASLSVKYEFYKHLKMLSFDLFRVVDAFVNKFKTNDERSNDYNLFIAEGESENAEDIEVPKALGDIFESVAGAIYLDSRMSLDAVWNVYFKMMKPEIEYFSSHVPKSPIRELLEMEPQNAKFGKPELIPGRKIRVCVEVFDEGKFYGIGRNKRIAKCTAAKRALRALKSKRSSNGISFK